MEKPLLDLCSAVYILALKRGERKKEVFLKVVSILQMQLKLVWLHASLLLL